MDYSKGVDGLDRWASDGMGWMVDGLLTTLTWESGILSAEEKLLAVEYPIYK